MFIFKNYIFNFIINYGYKLLTIELFLRKIVTTKQPEQNRTQQQNRITFATSNRENRLLTKGIIVFYRIEYYH